MPLSHDIFRRARCASLFAAIAAAAPAFWALPAHAALTWDPNGPAAGIGGSGTWDTTTANWLTDTGTYSTWTPNAPSPNIANFPAGGGTVSLGGGSITDGSTGTITFDDSYTFTNGILNPGAQLKANS